MIYLKGICCYFTIKTAFSVEDSQITTTGNASIQGIKLENLYKIENEFTPSWIDFENFKILIE